MEMKTSHEMDSLIWVVESYILPPFAFILTALLLLGIDGQSMQYKKLAPVSWFQ